MGTEAINEKLRAERLDTEQGIQKVTEMLRSKAIELEEKEQRKANSKDAWVQGE